MDVKDVSDVDEYMAYLKRVQANAERANRRKGQMVRNHPPREQVISTFMMRLFQSRLRSESMQNAIATSQVPPPYTPCGLSAAELQPITISEMKLETHHRGKKTLVRVLTPPDRMTAIMSVAEDEQGTTVLLQLYYQPDESVMPAEEIVHEGRVCILKEPFFKCASDGSYSLRVDHLGDLIWLEDHDERVPRKWRRKVLSLGNSSSNIRLQGNDAVQNQKWAEAERLYSSAISAAETPEEEQLAYLNRSLANLKLGYPEKALCDAVKGSDDAVPSEKRLFREARALYELGDFPLCLEKLQTLSELHPENKAVKPELGRVKARVEEEQTGDYNFRQMYKQAKSTPPNIDCATFSGPVEIRTSPGRGRGLFINRAVSAGELLLCEKAFGYSYVGDDEPGGQQTILMNVSNKRMVMGGQANVLRQIVQKVYHNPKHLRQFVDLHRGNYPASPVLESDGNPVVDSFLVAQIISLNSFGAPRNSLATHAAAMSDTADMMNDSRDSHTTNGVWLLASRINHSCIGNCRRSFIGDMQIVRATQDLAAGTELFFSYRVPKLMETYEELQKQLNNWGFSCDCGLCKEKKVTPRKTLQRRKALLADLRTAMKGPRVTDISRAQRVLNQLEETYPRTEAHSVRMELWDPYFALGGIFISAGKPSDAVRMIVKGLEALGFDITANPPIGDSKTPQLRVDTWGRACDLTHWAFMNLFLAYQRLAPELCPIAKQYVEAAYSMVMGEKETVLGQFPELA